MSQLPALVHVVDTLERGGLERVVSELAIAQHARGQQVSVFSINDCSGFREMLEDAGVSVHVGGKQRGFDVSVLRLLRRLAAQADLLHTHNFVPNYYAAVALLGMRGAPCLVHSVHNMGTRLGNRRLRWLYRASLRRTARMGMVGAQVYRHFIDQAYFPPHRAEVLRNGISMDVPVCADERGRARRRLGIQPNALVLGSVGRLVEVKNHVALLRQMPALLAEHPQLQVVLIGGGPLHDALAQEAGALGVAAHLHLPGNRADVAELLPALDIFALPSHSEGLSIALLEACRAGLPIVATDVGGNGEVVQDGHTGLLVPAGSAPALHAALQRLLADAALRVRLGAAAQAWVRQHGSIEAMRASHDGFYRRALHG